VAGQSSSLSHGEFASQVDVQNVNNNKIAVKKGYFVAIARKL
jgi:hypothetical protein